MAFWVFVWWVVIPWWIRRGVRKALAAYEAGRNPPPAFYHSQDDFARRRARGLQYDPTDPGMNRGYVPSDGPEEN